MREVELGLRTVGGHEAPVSSSVETVELVVPGEHEDKPADKLTRICVSRTVPILGGAVGVILIFFFDVEGSV